MTYIVKKINDEYYDFSLIKKCNLTIACCGNDNNASIIARGGLLDINAVIEIDYSRYNKNQSIIDYENKYL